MGSRYWRGYRAALGRPFAVLAGQLVSFLTLSLYVKLMQMRYTAEYAAAWVDGGRLLINCLHGVAFCGQEIAVFAVLLATTALWRLCRPRPGRVARNLMWIVGFIVLPLLSAIEVLGLAHFALFLTPLGPEEVRMIGWSGHMLSAGNVLRSPDVVLGLLLAAVGYYVIPPVLWLPRRWAWRPVPIAAALLAGALAVVTPKPPVADALLVPHPLLWMLFGGRAQRTWQAAEDESLMTPMAAEAAAVQRSAIIVPAAFAVPATGLRAASRRRALSPTERPRNVLIVMLESTRAASVPFYNGAAPAGKDLVRLRDEAVVFEHVYAPVPTSAHALFSVLYGVYPYLGPFWTGASKSVIADSMAQSFGRAGYATHFYITGDLNYDDIRSFAARGFETVLDTNEWPGQEAYAMLPWGRDDRLLIEQVKQVLSNEQRPFFVVAMTSNAHHPYAVDHLPPAPAVADDNGRSAYERLVDYNLRLVVELYEWMKQRGIAERTLMLVLGDHGEAFGEHAGSYGHAAFIYDENVHIPCFILHPRRLGLPRRIAQLGSQVDVRATVLDIIGRRDSEPSDGMSLLHVDPDRQVITFTENGVSHFGVRDARFSYISTPHSGMEQVFDRSTDPGETRNIAAADPLFTARYRQRLQRWEAEHQLSLARVLQ